VSVGKVRVHALAFSADAKRLVVAAGDALLVFPVTTRGAANPIWRVDAAHGGSLVHALDMCGDRIVTGGADCAVRVWDAATASPVGCFQGHTAPVLAVAMRAPGAVIASASEDGTARIWFTRTGKCTHVLEGHDGPVLGVDCATHMECVATGSSDGTARIWGIGRRGTGAREGNSSNGMEKTPAEGKAMAIAPDVVLRGHVGAVTCVRFGAKRTAGLIFTAGEDGTSRAWETGAHFRSGTGASRKREQPTGPAGAGSELVSASYVFRGHSGPLTCIALGEHAEVLATASSDKAIKLWVVREGGRMARSLAGGGVVTAVAFTAGHTTLAASGTSGGNVKVWGIVPSGGAARGPAW